MSYTISVFDDPERIPELIELFSTGLGETTVEHWKWRLFTENGQQDRPFSIVVEDEKRKIIGMICTLPVRYQYENRVFRAVQIGDWVISPDCRGKGIARSMYEYLSEYLLNQGYDFFIGFPNQFSYPVLKKYGFHDIKGVTTWNSKSKLFSLRYNANLEKTINGITYLRSDVYPNLLLDNNENGRIIKNSTFMKWKYDSNPQAHYKWLSLWRGEICIGYFVYLLTNGRFRTAVNVYDWEFSESEDPRHFTHAIKILSREGHFVSFFGRYSDEKKRLLLKSGMREQKKQVTCISKTIGQCEIPELTLTRIDTDY